MAQAFQESTGYCSNCRRQVLIRRNRVGRPGCLLMLIVFTGGLWLLVILLQAALRGLFTLSIGEAINAWRCTQCGTVVRRGSVGPVGPPSPPALR